MKSRSCRDFAEARSAYVDGHLAEDERQALLRHLSDCSDCRQELVELHRLRSILTSRTADAPVPSDLSNRLAAIAAGSVDPADGGSAHNHRRVLTMSAAGVALVLALLAGVGYVAAPTESSAGETTIDPAAAVRSDFSATIAQLPLISDGMIAALLVDPSVLRSDEADVPDDPTMTGRELGESEAAQALERASAATGRTAYTGVQQVIAPRDSGNTAAEVEVDADPGHGATVEVRTLDGAQVTQGRLPTSEASRVGDNELLTALITGYRLSGVEGGKLMGRPVTLVEAQHRDSATDQPFARWWIDDETGLVLRQQSFDHAGRLVLSAGYTSLDIGASAPAAATGRSLTEPVTTAAFTTASAGQLSSQGWFCHSELAGMSLIRLRADAPEPGVLHMVYTDGLSTVSVFESRGPIDEPAGKASWDPALGAYRTDAILNTATWQSGTVTFTVATNGSVALRNTVVAALPHDEPADRTTMERVRAGWSRILEGVG